MPKHEFSVDMTCEGCADAATRVLSKLGGVQFEIDLPNKKTCIDSEHSMDTLLETLRKTGKTITYTGPKYRGPGPQVCRMDQSGQDPDPLLSSRQIWNLANLLNTRSSCGDPHLPCSSLAFLQ
ncbi:copper transport protein ATOX1-like [Molossus nigricans]